MRHQNTYSAVEIKQWDTDQEIKNGKWIPARPLPITGIKHLWRTFKIIYHVATGKYDALNWEGDTK
jgi:hypothetical protein